MPRRLMIVMLTLLVGVVVASAVAPPPERDRDREEARTAPATTTTPAVTSGEEASPAPSAADPLPPVTATLRRGGTVRVAAGQTAQLSVPTDGPATVEIPALGEIQPAEAGSPAQFVVAFDEPGRYAVRDAERGTALGTVVVTA